MKYTLIIVSIVLILGLGYWFFLRDTNEGPKNPPTAEEWERIEAVEQSSAQVAPNAVSGVGVRLEGDPELTEPEPVTETSTTTNEADGPLVKPDPDAQP
jgi:hypothetical protein